MESTIVCRRCSEPVSPTALTCTQCGVIQPARDFEAEALDAEREHKMRRRRGVVVTGIDIPFGELVVFLIKMGFAAIPAAIVLALTWGLVQAILLGAAFG